MIYVQKHFNQSVTNNIRTAENIGKIAAAQGDIYGTGCLLNSSFFKEHYKLFAISLCKESTKHWYKIKSTNYLRRKSIPAGIKTMLFNLEEIKGTILD